MNYPSANVDGTIWFPYDQRAESINYDNILQPLTEFQCLMVSINTLHNFFLITNHVYKFQCLRDSNKAYIGKTKRHLTTRVKEHYQGPSAIQNHLDSCNACKEQFSCQSFVVIDSGQTDFDITIKEALHIKHHRPWLNKQLHSQGSSFVLNIFWSL